MSFFKPRVIICVPSGITEVEERAVIDGHPSWRPEGLPLKNRWPQPSALASTSTQPDGHMVVDIGGGTADIAVISCPAWWRAPHQIAGDQLNEAVVKYMRRKHNLLVGERAPLRR